VIRALECCPLVAGRLREPLFIRFLAIESPRRKDLTLLQRRAAKHAA
jgi:hypothetical protein